MSSSNTMVALRQLCRGLRAERFLTDVQTKDPQQLMARVTGNYKRGNEAVEG